jgi:hypothetical protein
MQKKLFLLICLTWSINSSLNGSEAMPKLAWVRQMLKDNKQEKITLHFYYHNQLVDESHYTASLDQPALNYAMTTLPNNIDVQSLEVTNTLLNHFRRNSQGVEKGIVKIIHEYWDNRAPVFYSAEKDLITAELFENPVLLSHIDPPLCCFHRLFNHKKGFFYQKFLTSNKKIINILQKEGVEIPEKSPDRDKEPTYYYNFATKTAHRLSPDLKSLLKDFLVSTNRKCKELGITTTMLTKEVQNTNGVAVLVEDWHYSELEIHIKNNSTDAYECGPLIRLVQYPTATIGAEWPDPVLKRGNLLFFKYRDQIRILDTEKIKYFYHPERALRDRCFYSALNYISRPSLPALKETPANERILSVAQLNAIRQHKACPKILEDKTL